MGKLSLKYADLNKILGAYAVSQRTESRQFLAWFLNHYYRLDEGVIDDVICDGHDDRSIDGIYVIEQSSEIHVFQSRIVKGPKTLGDTALKEFCGSLSQFRSREAIQNIISITRNKDLANVLTDQDIADKIEKGYKVKAVFVTNAPRDDNAKRYLPTVPDLILYDEVELLNQFVPIDKTEPIADETAFDISSVPSITYPIGSTLKMVLAPISALELVKMKGINNGELFAYNVRQSLQKTKVNDDIAASIKSQEEHQFFPAFHNGITVLCKKMALSPNETNPDKITISGYAVVNGCQSLTALDANRDKISSDLRILVKFIQTEPQGKLAAKITDHTNNQNGTTARDLQSNTIIQTRLQSEINGKGEFCYRIKRGEHPEWETDNKEVIENDLAASILLAFDVKEPWACHQSYKLFDELHARIFARPEVTGGRIVILYRIYDIVWSKTKHIENQLFAKYKLTRFYLLYLLREALETDPLGKKFCANPSAFIGTKRDQDHLLECVDKVAQAVVRIVNGDAKRRGGIDGFGFDFKRDLKSPKKIREMATEIISRYQVMADDEMAPTFSNKWNARKKGAA